jgi:ACR3 family arsenite efflux pump ArsB
MNQTEIMNWTGLLLELTVLFLLIFGVGAAKSMKDLKGHYKIQALATFLNLIAVIFLMVPRFLNLTRTYIDYGMDTRSWVVVLHHTIGGIGVVLSLYVVLMFAGAKGDMSRCPNATLKGRRLMRSSFILLMIPLLIGIGLRLTAL